MIFRNFVFRTFRSNAQQPKSNAASVEQQPKQIAQAHPVQGQPASPTQPDVQQIEIEGLYEWLAGLGAANHYQQALDWCAEMGAASLDEVIEYKEELGESLGVALEPPKFKINGFERWLGERHLDSYYDQMTDWCKQNDVVSLDALQNGHALKKNLESISGTYVSPGSGCVGK